MKIIILIIAVLIFAVSATAARNFHYEFRRDVTIICPDCDYWYSCESNSMYPTIKSCNNTLIAVEPNSRKDIKVGDIIWFHGTKKQLSQYQNPDVRYIVHRIIGIDYKGCYITKGDNNDAEDDYTPCYYDVKFIIKGVVYS